jgi:AcrR family transcriptional regulator
MARPPASKRNPKEPLRTRRTAEEARNAILDAAEKRLVEAGPAGIRLQEVAADVGVSHPTVLHHFGSREGLIEAVVARALDSLHAGLLAAVGQAPQGADHVATMLDSVYAALLDGGHARAFLWLALSGYAPTLEQFHVRSLAEAVHEVRKGLWKESGRTPPPFEDTYFAVLLPALALVTLSVTTAPGSSGGKGGTEEGPCGGRRFRTWLAKVVHDHLQGR